MEKDATTEERIKEAARQIFQQKGYAATRTRDIAQEAGINLALLNYYFRSKEKLFEMVMDESVKKLFFSIQSVLNDPSPLPAKINLIIDFYIDLLTENPNLPVFILGEVQANPEQLGHRFGLPPSFITQTVIYTQLETHLKSVGMETLNPLHILTNILSLTIFPFVGKPLLHNIAGLDETEFQKFVEERKILIPLWIKRMLQINETEVSLHGS